MKLFLSVFFILFNVLLGCSATTPQWTYVKKDPPAHVSHTVNIPIWIQDSFSKAQMAEIKDAIKEWNFVFNGQVVLTIEPTFTTIKEADDKLETAYKTGLGIVVVNLPENSPFLLGTIEEGDGVLAFVRGRGAHLLVVIGDRIGNRNLKTIAMHEFGHLFGCFHVNVPNTLMVPYYGNGQANCIDKISAAQAADFFNLDFNTVKYCVTPNFK